MARRHLGVAAAVAVAVSAAACSNDTPSAPHDGPALAKAPSPYACVFTGNPSLSNAANSYFTTTDDRQIANDYIDAMAAGFADGGGFAGARDAGFDLLAFTGTVSRGTTAGDSGDGGVLVRQAVQCMFDVEEENDSSEAFFGWPTDKQFDFGRALTSAAAGAFFVRGGTTDPSTSPVVANDESVSPTASGNISGIAPPAGNNWPAIVATGILPDRVLIYGEPVTGGYDWKLMPRSTAFIPSATVALCPAATAGAGTTADMIAQETVGVLGYVVGADFICQVDPDDFAFAGPSGAFAMFARLGRSVGRWFEPSPLQAAVLSSTIGGSASGAKADQFTVEYVPTVILSFDSPGQQPPPNLKVNTRFSLEVNVKTPDGDPAGGITVNLAAITNNGSNTAIYELTDDAPATGPVVCALSSGYVVEPSETTLGTVGAGGERQPTNAVWDNNLCFSKTGSVYVTASSIAEGRTGGIGSAKSNKVNVRP